MDENRLAILFQKYLSKTATESERKAFFQMVTLPGADLVLRKYGQLFDLSEAQWRQLDKDSSDRIFSDIIKETEINVNNINRTVEFKPVSSHMLNEGNQSQDKLTGSIGELPANQDHSVPVGQLVDQTNRHTENPSNDSPIKQPSGFVRSLLAAAAIIILIIGGYLYKLTQNQKVTPPQIVGNQVLKDVLPGHSGAVLTLSNGQSFLLDTMSNGQIAGGIIKSADALRITNSAENRATLKTPLGRQQMLVLNDGTKVWLNAGSSISFPTAFTGKKRMVRITGEAYFEVVHNEKMPFEVQTGREVIYDLGTHFNVNAYDNESAMKVTLLEGSVQVGAHTVLKPGQAYSAGKVSEVNGEDAIAWVSGYFHFVRADIKTVMRQLSRWYDVQVTYEGQLPAMEFGGDIQKSLKLSAVLDILSETGIHYTLNGKNLTIRP